MKNQHYLKAIEALGKRIEDLETDLLLKDYEIQDLKIKLKEAEEAGAKNGGQN